MKKIFLLLAAMMSLVANAQNKKMLVLYYSQTNTTKAVAEELQKKLGADIEGITVEKPYTGDFQQTIARWQEERGRGELPTLIPLTKDLKQYDVIFLGYPIWGGTYAPPIEVLLKQCDFAGKTIVPFCTFGSGGLNTSSDALKQALPQANIKEGYGVRAARIEKAPQEIDYFLKANGYVKGKVEKLSDFSAQQPVSDAEKQLFDAACSSYQFPLGTPSTVGKRTTGCGTEYKFIVKGRGMDGSESQSVIYVVVGNEQGAQPEFTQVVR